MSRPTSSRSSPAATSAPSTSDLSFPDPPRSTVTSVVFSPAPSTATAILVSSWDHHVHHYRIDTSIPCPAITKIQTFPHEAPVLDVCFITSDLAASAGVDRRIRLLDLTSGKTMILGKHEDSILKLRWCPFTQMLISGSADRSLCFWEVNSDKGATAGSLLKQLDVPDKVIVMDVSPPFPQTDSNEKIYSASSPGHPHARDSTPRLVVGMAGRHVFVYDLIPLRNAIDNELAGKAVRERDWQPDQRRESSLKFMARDLRCMPAGDGYAMSSIEGRIAVEFFDTKEKVQAMKYAFKCHRETVKDGAEVEGGMDEGDDMEKPYDVVYPVHGVAFHPRHGTFASLGGDSIVSVWDAAAKKRIRQYPKLNSAVTAGTFDPSGNLLLLATGNDKVDSVPNGEEDKVELVLKCNAWNECKPKLKSGSGKK